MTRKEYLKELLKRGFIQYKWVGSECSMDCVSFDSDLFYENKSFCLYIKKLAWDDIEEVLSGYLNEKIEKGELWLEHDVVGISLIDCTPEETFVDLFYENAVIIKRYKMNNQDLVHTNCVIFNKAKTCLLCYNYKNSLDEEVLFHDENEAYAYLLKKHIEDSISAFYRKEENLLNKVRDSVSGKYHTYFLDITDETKGLFGEAISKVEMSLLAWHEEEPEDERNEELFEKICYILTDLKLNPTKINCEETMEITFANGHSISIWNSEWCTIRKKE